LVDELGELPEQLWALVAGLVALRRDGRRDFIVVTGFALALAPMSNGGKLHGGARRFLRRRTWRPAHWAVLILSMVVTAFLLRPGLEPAAPPPPPPAPQCSDVIDNADPEDTLVDLADPGCTANDSDEGDPAPAPLGDAQLQQIDGGTSSYTWTGLQPSTPYRLDVWPGLSGNHMTKQSLRVTATTQTEPPTPPDGCIPGPVITILGSPTDPQRRELLGNTYHVHPNEWYASAPFAITFDGCLNFRISRSEIDVPLGGPVGAYPSIYKGCLWAYCTSNSGLPQTVAKVRNPGTVKTSTSTTLGAPGRWNSSYDIWFSRDPAPRSTDCSFQPSSTCGSMEMMIWLNHSPPNPGEPPGNPAGQLVASNVNLGGRTYNVWRVGGGRWQGDEGIVTYQMTNYVTSVRDLDLAPLATDAVNRGYMTTNHHLLTVMHGFEIVRNGVGLSVDSYEVTVTPP
jgi:hypothetical protein